MAEIEGTIIDGETVIVAGAAVILDDLDAVSGSADGAGWHAHVALPLGMVIQPGEQMRLETADGRSGPVALLDAPTIEGDRVLYEFTGLGPLAR